MLTVAVAMAVTGATARPVQSHGRPRIKGGTYKTGGAHYTKNAFRCMLLLCLDVKQGRSIMLNTVPSIMRAPRFGGAIVDNRLYAASDQRPVTHRVL